MMKPARQWLAPATLAIAILGGTAAWRFAMPQAAQASEPAPATHPVITVSVTSPRHETWPTLLPASGSVAAWQEAIIGAEVGSLRIVELNADVGQAVKRGQVLARLADAALQASLDKQNAALAQARANLKQAEANVARARVVASSGALSGQKIDDYAIAEATTRAAVASAEADVRSTTIQLGQTRIVAVDDGFVSSRSAVLGNVVAAGSELFRLVRQGRIEWRAEVDAKQLGEVRAGQLARLGLPDGRQAEGRVRLVAPTVSATTNRVTVFVSLPSASGAQPGMFASGTIEGAPTPALTLPQSAVVLRDGRNDVYLMKNDGTVTRRTVDVGRRIGDRVELLTGLDDTAQVVESGGAFLAEGVSVALASKLASSSSSAVESAR